MLATKSKFTMNAELWRYVIELQYKYGKGQLSHQERRNLAFYVAELNLGTQFYQDLPYAQIKHLLTPVSGRELPNCTKEE